MLTADFSRSVQFCLRTLVLTLATLSAVAPAIAGKKDDLPAVSSEGLRLVQSDHAYAVYLRDGADFGSYNKVALMECYVAFRKNWERDQRSASGFRIRDEDVLDIKNKLALEFNKVFTEELTARGSAVVDTAGTGVLVLRPAIINLDVAAPDVMPAGRSRSFTTSAGSMTLYLEVFDGVTGELLARVIDPEKARDFGRMSVTNGVTNRADADRILKQWAAAIGDYLEQARVSANTARSTTITR